jgi:hypothetical protein
MRDSVSQFCELFEATKPGALTLKISSSRSWGTDNAVRHILASQLYFLQAQAKTWQVWEDSMNWIRHLYHTPSYSTSTSTSLPSVPSSLQLGFSMWVRKGLPWYLVQATIVADQETWVLALRGKLQQSPKPVWTETDSDGPGAP